MCRPLGGSAVSSYENYSRMSLVSDLPSAVLGVTVIVAVSGMVTVKEFSTTDATLTASERSPAGNPPPAPAARFAIPWLISFCACVQPCRSSVAKLRAIAGRFGEANHGSHDGPQS